MTLLCYPYLPVILCLIYITAGRRPNLVFAQVDRLICFMAPMANIIYLHAAHVRSSL